MQVVIKFKVVLVFVLLLFFAAACIQSRPKRIAGYPRPYKVFSQWYQPIPSAKGFSQIGLASWYGKKFHGRKTANGEIYDMYAFTAAHKTLPLGTLLHVENLENGKIVEVRVNDRGPFVGERIIDLSYKAATMIDMTGNGTARVKIIAIDKRKADKPADVAIISSTGKLYSAQAGSFSNKKNAEGFRANLGKIYKDVRLIQENGVYKIRVGKHILRSDAEKTKTILRNAGYSAFIVQE